MNPAWLSGLQRSLKQSQLKQSRSPHLVHDKLLPYQKAA